MSLFEAHITIEPVFVDRLDQFKALAQSYNFKVAHLLMVKDRKPTEQRSDRDSFCTGHFKDYYQALEQTRNLAVLLTHNGFKVWRYKIESVLLDVRFNDASKELEDVP